MRKLAAEMRISKTSTQRILRREPGYFRYTKIKQPKLTGLQKKESVKFANWILNHCTKDESRQWFFSDEKFFDLDGPYNSENDQVWAANREEAEEKGGLHEKIEFPQKVMLW